MDDLLAVVRLVERSPDKLPSGLTERQRETWGRMMAASDLTVYVAALGRDAVGSTAMLVMPHLTYECRPTAFIEPMYVVECHRRRGVGRMLVERALADARLAGCHKVQVLSHKRHADDGAHDFYRSLGFVAEAEGFRLYLSGF
jgi:GNAT superfamily N-acetyltransferase